MTDQPRLKVLHISNWSVPRCGMSNFAQQFSTALRRAGCAVDDWDGTYPVLYAKREACDPGGVYTPANVGDYDVVHFNWHPATINHYGSGHFAEVKGVCSIYLHDLPPWSSCPCLDVMQVRITSEPHAISTLEVPYPIPDWVTDLPEPHAAFTVGWSGIRGDGFALLEDVCLDHGWTANVSTPGVWLSLEDEVRRLARSTVNVCWYQEGRGRSGAASMCLASRRPLLINPSPMLSHLFGYPDVYLKPHLDDALFDLYRVAQRGQLIHPGFVLHDLSWTQAAEKIVAAWEAALR